jgi:O-antigen ligase
MYDTYLNLEASLILILTTYFVVLFVKQVANQGSSLALSSNLLETAKVSKIYKSLIFSFGIGVLIGILVLFPSFWPFHPLICRSLILSLGTFFLHESFLIAFFVLLLFIRPWELIEAQQMAMPLSFQTYNTFKGADLVSIPKFWFLLLLGNLLLGWTKRKKIEWNQLDLGIFLFLIWILIPILATQNKEHFALFSETILKAGLVYFILRAYFQSEFYFQVMAKTIGLIGFFLVTLTLMQFYFNGFQTSQLKRAEAFGLIQNSNDLAALIVLCFPFAFKSIKPVWLKVVWIGINYYAIFLTQSRGAFLGLSIGGLAYYFANKSVRMPKLKTLILVLVALVCLFKFYTIFLGRSESDIHASTMGRFNYWVAAVRMAIRSPIWGVGFANYPLQFEKYAIELLEFGERTAHSSFFLVLAETGLVGLFLFLILFKKAFSFLNKIKMDYPDLYSAFIGYSVTMIFLSHSYLIFIYILFALINSVRSLSVGNLK